MKNMTISTVILSLALAAYTALGASMTPPGPPSAGSGMPTMNAVFQQLSSGQKATPSASFQGPTAGPGASGRDMSDIARKLPVFANISAASPSDVKAGMKYWGLKDGAWGVKSGTLSGGGYPCTGTMNGTRWCDNGNGTVRDMTTGLIWLKDAGWGGQYPWWSNMSMTTTVFDRVSLVRHGNPETLTDGSAAGDWRMPTKAEMVVLGSGKEAVLVGTPRSFNYVQGDWYWTSVSQGIIDAVMISMTDGIYWNYYKDANAFVWPVRSGQ